MADLPVPTVNAEQARETVTEVLSREEYADLEPGPLDELVDRIVRTVARLWEQLAGTGEGTVLGYVLLVVIVAVVALLLWRLVRSLRPDAAADPLDGDIGRPPVRWLDDAREHEEAGRFRDAVRCRYRALIAELAAAGRLEEVPGRTAGEYLATVREELPGVAEAFAAATRTFEAAWYGPDDVGPADVDAMRGAAAGIGAMVGSGGR